jgi:hypothetical protein
MTGVEILAQGSPSEEAKRFITIYSNSVKSNPRFQRIVEKFHTKDEFTRTVRALLAAAIRYFKLLTENKDQIADIRTCAAMGDVRRSVLRSTRLQSTSSGSPTANTPAKEKPASLTYVIPDKSTKERFQTDSERSNAGDSFQPRDQSEVIRDGNTSRCASHPSSSKTHWTWECKGGKKRETTPKIKIQHQLDASSAFATRSSARIL